MQQVTRYRVIARARLDAARRDAPAIGPDELNAYNRAVMADLRGIKGPGGHVIRPPKPVGYRVPAGLTLPLTSIALGSLTLAGWRQRNRAARELEEARSPSTMGRSMAQRRWNPPGDSRDANDLEEALLGGASLGALGSYGGEWAGRRVGPAVGAPLGRQAGQLSASTTFLRPTATPASIVRTQRALPRWGEARGARMGRRLGGRYGALGGALTLGALGVGLGARHDFDPSQPRDPGGKFGSGGGSRRGVSAVRPREGLSPAARGALIGGAMGGYVPRLGVAAAARALKIPVSPRFLLHPAPGIGAVPGAAIGAELGTMGRGPAWDAYRLRRQLQRIEGRN